MIKILWSFLLVLVLLGQARAQDITSNLINHWPMNQSSGTSVPDVAGSATGTLTNSTSWVAGKVGSNAVDLTPASSYINVGDIAAVGGASALTAAAWVYPTLTHDFRAVIAQLNYAGGYTNTAFSLGHSPTNVTWVVTSDGASTGMSTATAAALPLNTWSHIAGTHDGTNIKLYVNGTLLSTVARTGTVFNSTNTVQIGAELNNGVSADFWGGYIDDVRLYTRALTQPDIQALVDLGGTSATVVRRRPLFLE